MLDELNADLRDALDREFEAVRLASHLRKLKEDLDAERRRWSDLEEKLAKEKREVARLEGLGLTSLFLAVLGTKEARLDRERRELLAARLAHEECEASIAALEADAATLGEQLAALGDIEGNLRDSYRTKQQALIRRGGRAGKLLQALTLETAAVRARGVEVREALVAGGHALEELDALRSTIASARDWSCLDLLGGAFVTTMIKHHKIDGSKKKAHSVKQALARLNREIADLEERGVPDLQVEIGPMLTFADYFFDGLIVDWIAHSRIEEAQNRVDAVRTRVRAALDRLRTEERDIENDLAEAETRRRKLIERG